MLGYELSGVVAAVAGDVDTVAVGDEVFALTPFDRDGVAAEYAAVLAWTLAAKPSTLRHAVSAALPLPALSAWQGLFTHGRLEPGERVLVHGAVGGVGQFATQLARWRGAHVIATASPPAFERARALGADAVIDGRTELDGRVGALGLIFDTVGGDIFERAPDLLADGGRLVTVAAEPPSDGTYFVVEPRREQLLELARLADDGELQVAIDSTFVLADGPLRSIAASPRASTARSSSSSARDPRTSDPSGWRTSSRSRKTQVGPEQSSQPGERSGGVRLIEVG